MDSPTVVELSQTLLLLQVTRQSFAAMKLRFSNYAPEEGAEPAGEHDLIADAIRGSLHAEAFQMTHQPQLCICCAANRFYAVPIR